MLSMLPKLALVVVKMYLSELAKVTRPSSTPRRRTSNPGSKQDEVGRFAGDVHGPFDGDPDIGVVEGRCVIDAIAQVADDVPGLLQGADDALLLVGIDLGEQGRHARPRCHRASSRMELQIGSSHDPLHRESDRPGHVHRHAAVVARDDLEAHPEGRQA